MKRALMLGIVALELLVIASNVRVYTDVPDPASNYHVVQGVVLILPSVDQCYGLELEHDTNIISPYGGDCQ